MIRALCLVLLAVLAAPLAAQELPARHTVTGVALDDTLNIRSAPAASADIVGELSPGASGVEVIRLSNDGLWGLIGLGEGNGWVSMRYMAAEETGGDGIPRPLRCFGTEPFWSLELGTGTSAQYHAMGFSPVPLETRREIGVGLNSLYEGAAAAQTQGGPEDIFILVSSRGRCSDGMSDRAYGLRATLFLERGGQLSTASGCCTLDAR